MEYHFIEAIGQVAVNKTLLTNAINRKRFIKQPLNLFVLQFKNITTSITNNAKRW